VGKVKPEKVNYELPEYLASKVTYTALREFADDLSSFLTMFLHAGSVAYTPPRLLSHYDSLKIHLGSMEAMPHASFTNPLHPGALTEGLEALEEGVEV
jgi:hypothetical protein